MILFSSSNLFTKFPKFTILAISSKLFTSNRSFKLGIFLIFIILDILIPSSLQNSLICIISVESSIFTDFFWLGFNSIYFFALRKKIFEILTKKNL